MNSVINSVWVFFVRVAVLCFCSRRAHEDTAVRGKISRGPRPDHATTRCTTAGPLHKLAQDSGGKIAWLSKEVSSCNPNFYASTLHRIFQCCVSIIIFIGSTFPAFFVPFGNFSKRVAKRFSLVYTDCSVYNLLKSFDS